MQDYLAHFFSSADFMPHGHCYLWKPALVWMMAGSDLLIGLSYACISISLVVIIRRVRLPFSGMFLAFGLFIAACGLGHFLDLLTLWQPYYWMSAGMRVITAVASVTTAILVFPLISRVVAAATELQLSEKRRLMLENSDSELREINRLRNKEVRDFTATFAACPDHIYRLNSESKFEYISPSALKFFNITQATAIGKRWTDLGLTSEPAQTLDDAKSKVVESRTSQSGELKVALLSGVSTFEYVISPIFDDYGMLLGICVNLHDVTQKRQSEDALKETQERFRLLVNGVKDYAIYMLDPEGRVMSWNEGATRIKGYLESEIIGKHFSIFYSPEEIENQEPQLALDRALVSNHCEGEGWRIRKNGTRFYADFVLTTLRTADGRLRGFAKITHDITEKKKTEESLKVAYEDMERNVLERTEELRLANEMLQNSQKEYKELVNTVDGIVWEAVVGKPGYTFISRQVERLLGYPVERWLGEDGFWKSTLHPEDRDRLTGEKYLRPEQKIDSQLEYRVVTADGRTVWFKDYIKVLCDAGVPVKMRGIMVDITDRKKTEAELQIAQTSALQSAAVKSEFLANVTHEIRTPLNAIIGMATIGLDTEMNEEQRDCLTTVKTAADSLLVLINDILDFSKVEAGKVELEMSDFKLPNVCKSAIEVISPVARGKELELKVELDGDLIEDVRGDPGRLLQIFLNLLSNAVKFSSQSGQVAFRAKVIQRNPGSSTRVRFEVEDKGVGISEEAIKRLFQPFTQADPSTARKYGGTGLGLSICKNLVALMGGEIGVKSLVGQGAMFWVEVPFSPASAPVATLEPITEKAEPSNLAGKVHILVAEDNPANQKVVRRFLEKLGCTTEVVADGREAVASFELGAFDLIFMDCQMPEMDGYTATRKIREIEKTTARIPTPIVALTAHAFSGDREKCKKSGMDGYLSKPIHLGELENTIKSWIKSRPSIDVKYLEELDQLNGEGQSDLVLELIDCFKTAGPEKMLRIRKAFETDAIDVLEKEAHAFKSTCHNVGAKQLAAICEQIETPARKKDQNLLKKAPHLLNQLETEFARALSELAEIAKKRVANLV